ncbi:DUF3142 domain-containing protein [Paraburkholderia domus]|uniref:DUF3142 domain-containing protein n=1 Tax=Paraburkholderia domus TaxID=2793075 RepID=UPI001913EB91|nr:DUF3142 domain-containing protein [Paraburkholderia domus]MBK5064879.1 DUF3142 domain-containing protein [Burkholderia sp. R-70199]CAE6947590.1 hypothetical protein R70199_06448 [Paraburkholderia domus]
MNDGGSAPARRQVRGALAACAVPLLVLVLTLVGACGKPSTPLSNDAYIWQRKWTPPVTSAFEYSRGFVQTWHVLAAEKDTKNDWTIVSPDWTTLTAAHAPVTAVIRIEGQLDDLNALPVAHIVELAADWKQHGITLAAIEIDHDCATSRLAVYTRFLAALRAQLDPTVKLTITALPAWLDSSALDALLAQADESVLQVHAVMNPAQGLFDPTQARAWLGAFAQRTKHPWRVALPTYGSRVTWGDDGRVAGIESERPMLLANGVTQDVSHELVAQPEQISAFVTQIERHALPGLKGIVWFRLPTDADERAWSLATWRAVLTRAPLTAAIAADVRKSAQQSGLFDVSLVSGGSIDAPLPAVVRADSSCEAADGINGYALDYDARGMLLRRVQPGLLHAGRRRDIGWLRCGAADNKKVSVHVEP